jgi:hypothetical protein
VGIAGSTMQTEERQLALHVAFPDDTVSGFVARERDRPFVRQKRHGHPITPNLFRKAMSAVSVLISILRDWTFAPPEARVRSIDRT